MGQLGQFRPECRLYQISWGSSNDQHKLTKRRVLVRTWVPQLPSPVVQKYWSKHPHWKRRRVAENVPEDIPAEKFPPSFLARTASQYLPECIGIVEIRAILEDEPFVSTVLDTLWAGEEKDMCLEFFTQGIAEGWPDKQRNIYAGMIVYSFVLDTVRNSYVQHIIKLTAHGLNWTVQNNSIN